MANDYGPLARTALQVATAEGWCTQDSFAAFLSAKLRHGACSRAQVASWETGREHMPVDVLGHLCAHTGHGQELLTLLAGPLDLLVIPKASGAGDEDLLRRGCRANSHVAAILEHLQAERDENGDGGANVTPDERRRRLALIQRAEQELAAMRVATEGGLRSRHLVVSQ